jgi:hypothetical protein
MSKVSEIGPRFGYLLYDIVENDCSWSFSLLLSISDWFGIYWISSISSSFGMHDLSLSLMESSLSSGVGVLSSSLSLLNSESDVSDVTFAAYL